MRIAICAIIKDEHRYLKEWIDWNLKTGFNEIHLFEDFGSKSHKEIVREYDNMFLHSITECGATEEMRDVNHKASIRQHMLYEWFAKSNIGKIDWCAFIDVDEYIMTEEGVSFLKLLDEFNDKEGLYLYWKMKGASGHIKRPEGSVVDNYTEDTQLVGGDSCWDMKSVVNLNKYKGIHSIHQFKGLYNTAGLQTARIRCFKKAWINHYFTKSWEDWTERFLHRGDLVWGHRRVEQFFECNPSMRKHRVEMMEEFAKSLDLDVDKEIARMNFDDTFRRGCRKKSFYASREASWNALFPMTEDVAIVRTCKNGCTTVFNSLHGSKKGTFASSNGAEDEFIAREFNGKIVAVYRDPVERFLSFYAHHVMSDYAGTDWVDFACVHRATIDDTLNEIEEELKKGDPYNIDDHIRRQVDFYPRIDMVVRLEDLDDYLCSIDVAPAPVANVHKGAKYSLTEAQKARVKNLYKDDYKLLELDVWDNPYAEHDVVGVDLVGRLGNELYTCGYAISKYGTNVRYKLNGGSMLIRRILMANGIHLVGRGKEKCRVHGLHQSYYDMDWSVLKDVFKCPKDIKERIAGKYPNIKDMVVCHIRRGDFEMSDVAYKYRVLTAEYVERAKNKYFADKKMLVVSDDIPWCEKNIKDAVFSHEDVLFDFYALVMAGGVISSASTFSIMACSLNGGNVVVPAPLYTDKGKEDDACLREIEDTICSTEFIREEL